MSQPASPAKRRRVSPATIAVGILVVIATILISAAGIYTDLLWFSELEFQSVFLTQIIAQVVLFLAGFAIMFVITLIAFWLAYRHRPVYLRMPGESPFENYQQVIDNLRRLIMFGVPGLLGVFAGTAATAQWTTALQFFNSTPSGKEDSQFGMDVSFYLFELPFLTALVSFLSAAVLLAALIAGAVHLIYGGIRLDGRSVKVAKPARIQLSITAAIYFLVQGVSLWLNQYETVFTTNELFTGARYSDVNATIPGLQILALISILVAALFIVTAIIGSWRYSIIATGLMIISSVVLGGLYPWAVQTFQVAPTERTLETPYLERNIEATRDAYGLNNIDIIDYEATTTATPGALRADAETTTSIRILDPSLVSDAFRQLEQYRQYYSFPERLHVGRYEVDGEPQDAVLGVRELDQAGLGDTNSWYNSTIVFTHGYGLVAAYGNKRDTDGQPLFFQSGIPSIGELGEFEPRVYFGENSPEYSIVGGTNNEDLEFDFPAGEGTENQTYTTFEGSGGPNVGSLVNRIAFALKFQSEQILLSDAINPDSQIIYDRDPKERIQAVAPYLTVDSQAYPAVVDGEVLWIVDAYTTNNNYPYSNSESMNLAIIDSSTESAGFGANNINYIRNSVKATVNAYDGEVKLYAWDENDPVLATWRKIFPDTVRPVSEMSGELMSHVRYPSDLFKVQRSILGRYHVTDPGAFYSQQDAWMTPNDPVDGPGIGVLQPPYYLTMQTPGMQEPNFSLYTTFIPQSTGQNSRNVLTGYLVASGEAGDEAGKVSDRYGKLRLLSLPRETIIPGPGQVQNNFNADSEVSQLLNILRQGSTRVLNGNLLTLPVGGGFLYVQPVYIESTGETSFPLLQKVLVSFGDRIAFEDTLDEALDELFGGDSGASAGDSVVPGADGEVPADDSGEESAEDQEPVEDPDQPTEEPTEEPSEEPTGGEVASPDLDDALERAEQAIQDKQEAFANGDWTAFGEADDRLNEAIQDAVEAINN
ncbi:MAG: UPF0182 family protein [Microbacteriaceae bacterium]|nr:UPF0182 family protein [Microbacteriaceae bacterium]